MFKLRKEHLEGFEAQVIKLFARRVIAHVKAVWPTECADLGDPLVEELVQAGIKRAATHGLTLEYDIVRFVDLTFILARDFETNPMIGWTKTILSDRTLAPAAKVDRLYQRLEVEFDLIEKRKAGKP